MSPYESPRLLITNNQLYRFGGSEIVTLELAEEFVARGWKVDVYTNYLDDPFAFEFDELTRSGQIRLSDDEDIFSNEIYDLLWIHQAVLPSRLILNLADPGNVPKTVWHHMSSFVPLEMPILADIELSFAQRISTISPEAVDALVRAGIERDRISLFANPVPRSFVSVAPANPAETLSKIIVVSNHVPPELSDACSRLEAQGVSVVWVGGDHPLRVSPAMLSDADAVVTIGKTTQFALCLGIPVFQYDIHGGCGWLTEANVEPELATNFSGRATQQKLSPEEIENQILSGFSSGRAFAVQNVAAHRERFSLELQVDAILGNLQNQTGSVAPLSTASAKRWSDYAFLMRSYYRAVTGANNLRNALQLRVEELENSEAVLEAERQRLLDSRPYRYGNALLAPLAWLKELFSSRR